MAKVLKKKVVKSVAKKAVKKAVSKKVVAKKAAKKVTKKIVKAATKKKPTAISNTAMPKCFCRVCRLQRATASPTVQPPIDRHCVIIGYGPLLLRR